MTSKLSFIALTFLALFAPTLRAEDQAQSHCVTDHLKEAVALNTERRSLYSTLSNGESEEISDALIASEKTVLKNLKPTMLILKYYWTNDVPVLCREFVPMSETPSFAETFSSPVPEGKPSFVNPLPLAAHLNLSFVAGGRKKLRNEALKAIKNLDKPNHYQCMMKHVLESIVLAADVADEVNKIAAERKMPSPNWISNLSLQSQISMLPSASRIDRKTENLHSQGIPIICNDVPVILKDLHLAD